jgi:L-lactate dehydrogenase complex protein LldG
MVKTGAASGVEAFTDKAVQAGAEVERVPSAAAARDFLSRLIRKNGWTRIMASEDARDLVPPEAVPALLEPDNLSGYVPAEVGLTRAAHGVAATGTLVRWDSNDDDRMAATIVPVCVCALDASAVVDELEAVADEMAGHLRPGRAPGFSQVSLITGPSRTADIEAELTLGVHGPGRLIILVIGS